MRYTIALTAALGLAMTAGSALAAIPSTVMTIGASSSLGSASWQLDLTDPNGFYVPNIGNGAELFLFQVTLAQSPIELRDSGTNALIGLITQADVLIGGNPGDLLSPARIFAFAYTVNSMDADTTFSFSGGDYGLDAAYGGASGFASSAVTLTDGTGDGALMSANGDVYGADYNGGTNFSSLLSGYNLAAGAFGSNSDAGNDPGDFSNRFIGPVSSISASAGFTLSANDAASINTQFFVVPAPATVALMGLGGLVAARRRRV
ncbi:MAG: hypothetical protein ACI89L_002484 [Phycisphaerales bacterium]|jgi:hypothetical protein